MFQHKMIFSDFFCHFCTILSKSNVLPSLADLSMNEEADDEFHWTMITTQHQPQLTLGENVGLTGMMNDGRHHHSHHPNTSLGGNPPPYKHQHCCCFGFQHYQDHRHQQSSCSNLPYYQHAGQQQQQQHYVQQQQQWYNNNDFDTYAYESNWTTASESAWSGSKTVRDILIGDFFTS